MKLKLVQHELEHEILDFDDHIARIARKYSLISGGGISDHGELLGLADDDHSQYALLGGRSGGQTLIGGTASGETLTLVSTSHITKGKILFGTSAYDEVNNRLGIGTVSPKALLHGSTDAGSSPDFMFSDGDVSHNFTGIGGVYANVQTDTTFIMTPANTDAGGGAFSGFRDNDGIALAMQGHINAASPTAAAVTIDGYKTDGATSRTKLTGDEAILDIRAGSSKRVRFTAEGKIILYDVDDAFMTAGLVLNQIEYDNEILSFKSSDVAHGFTTDCETDTYTFAKKISAGLGGLKLVGLSDGDATGMQLEGWIGSTNPTDTTSAIILRGNKLSGTTTTALGNAETVLQVQNATTALATVLGNGNVGIGTTSPLVRLHVVDNTAPFRMERSSTNTTITSGNQWGQFNNPSNTDNNYAGISFTGYRVSDAEVSIMYGGVYGIFTDHTNVNGDLAFLTRNTNTVYERVRITSAGNVGIGEIMPDYKLDINGSLGFTPGSSVTPVDNGDVVIEATNNTTLTLKLKGSDGVVRSGTITLA